MTVLSARLGPSVAEHPLLEPHDAMGAETPTGVVHDHDWRLREVWHEDGNSTEEYSCTGCSGATFR
jgi:hypothetical protein